METKNIINIPKGYEIDRDKSTERQIVLNKIALKKIERPRTWDEYCEKMKGKDCYYVNNFYNEVKSSLFGDTPLMEEFDNKEDAVAFDAFCKLLKLRKDWVRYWKPDWTNYDQMKFTIHVEANEIIDCVNTYVSRSMCFPTEDMCNEFIDTFRDLLEIAKPLL